MEVAIGFYQNQVLAWRVDTSNPPQVVYREKGKPTLPCVFVSLEKQGFQPVIVFFGGEGGGIRIRLLA